MPKEPHCHRRKLSGNAPKVFLPELRNNASVENSYFPKPMVIFLGAVHKGQNREKLTSSSLVRKMSALAQTPLSVRTHHKFWKIRNILHQKVRKSASVFPLVYLLMEMSEKCPQWTNLLPSWLRTSFMDGPLVITLYLRIFFHSCSTP